MNTLNTLLTDVPPQLFFTGGILIAMTFGFLLFFLIPALAFRVRLGLLLKKLKKQDSRNFADLQRLFVNDPKLLHLWKEFRETLHEQHGEREGQITVIALRATVPAEAFFNGQYLVDNRLRTEFFKHLPGIFTGVGIIGTFFGLLTGLYEFNRGLAGFKATEGAGEKVWSSVGSLLHGVSEAFFVSAAAISLAMIVTFIEKIILTSLYRCVEDLAQHLDSLFQAGAGEEYLSRLVRASEDSASQSKILKDSLVGDLKVILQEIADQQTRASVANNQALAQQMTEGIRTSLREPLEKIGELVGQASGDQSAAASEMLKNVMTSFSQRLNDLFGGQITGLNELNQRTAQSMQDAVSSLHQLVGSIEAANQRSGEAMSDRMARAVEEMERRQSEINTQNKVFVEQIRQLVATSQTETNEHLRGSVADLTKQVTQVVGVLQAQSDNAFAAQQKREFAFTTRTENMVTSMGDTVQGVVSQLADFAARMQQSTVSLERTSTSAIDKMNSGAQTLHDGAVAFASAGDRVSGVMNQASGVASRMTEVSVSLTTSASTLQAILSDYRANREAMAAMLIEVRSIIETARREASLTESALSMIQASADKLTSAQHQADNYLEQVANVLAESHESFANGMTLTLDRANADFHNKLTSAVALLGATVGELDATLSSLTPARR